MSETTPRREATRQRLLQAAMGEFARHGIDATSVEQISEAAGFTRGAFYSNFEDKDALILALLEETHRATLAELEKWVAECPERERGEFVIVVEGREPTPAEDVGPDDDRVLRVLLKELPASTAATLTAQLTGKPRRALYARAVELSGEG